MAQREVNRDNEPTDAGTYPALIMKLENKVLEGVIGDNSRAEDRPVIEWTVLLKTTDGELKTETGLSSQTISPLSKAGAWVENAMGYLPEYSFDDEDLIGHACMVKIVTEERRTDRGSFTNSKIDEIQQPLNAYTDAYEELSEELDERIARTAKIPF